MRFSLRTGGVNVMGRVPKLVNRLVSAPDVEGMASLRDSVSEGEIVGLGIHRRRWMGGRIRRCGRYHVASRACTR